MKQVSTNRIKAIGLMSGTSLDGMDLVAAEFWQTGGKWNFDIKNAKTIIYSNKWATNIKNSPALPGKELMKLHAEYGGFIGRETNAFIKETGFIPDLISSHGHTVFHQPENGYTFQLGSGTEIAAATKITTVADFRTGDVALGGQGAPLVPVGDRLLFGEYDFCLNLGGFANISFEKNNYRIAFDICPVNFILNYFAEIQGFEFDKNGELGRRGKVNSDLLEKLNQLDFYLKESPKSLGREWVEQIFMPVLNDIKISDNDKLRTVYEHIAQQITGTVSGVWEDEVKNMDKNYPKGKKKMLVTGGGSFNTFLVELMSTRVPAEIVIPSNTIVNFKEALIFAFLGVLKIKGQINCLSSVTGALHDHSTGIIFQLL